MSTIKPSAHWLSPPDAEYPDSDGEPLADNTLQYEWITTIVGGLETLFRDDPDVFVAGDLFWYAVQGDPKARTAPDALVVFGRPKGHRGSYMQWREEGIAPQVVFEVLSPGNRAREMARKLRYYEKHGVEEYYIYDPDEFLLTGYLRDGSRLAPIPDMSCWISPRLGIRFEPRERGLTIFDPDGEPFQSYAELALERKEVGRRLDVERERADDERQRADVERQLAEAERQRADAERLRADRLADQLRALGLNPDA